MVSDSLTYVYSSHEWQQARATTSFGWIIENLLAHRKTLEGVKTAASAYAA